MVENKVDLLDDPNAEHSSELDEFAQNNEFIGAFRTSAKTGVNINESMTFLIKKIIERMENMTSKNMDVFTTDRKSVALDPDKHSEVAQRKQQKECCCK